MTTTVPEGEKKYLKLKSIKFKVSFCRHRHRHHRHHNMHLLSLIVGTLLLPNVYALKCFKCLPGGSEPCVGDQAEKACPSQAYQCGSMRISSYAGNAKLTDVHLKTCLLADECVEGSVTFGLSRHVVSSTCCTTDLCNNQNAPEIVQPQENGRKCYHCKGEGLCSSTLRCHGNEDHCITKRVNKGGKEHIAKGCASRHMCLHTENAQIKAAIGGDVSCCQGDFCNSGSSIRAGLLLLVTPLISLLMFS